MIDIDEIGKELQAYEKNNYGQKYGPDFSRIAKAVAETEQFTMKLFTGLMLSAMSIEKQFEKLNPDQIPNDKKAIPFLREGLRGNPLESVMLEMFYWGYASGKKAAEVEQLERMK